MSRTFLDAAGGQPLSRAAFETFAAATATGWASQFGLTHEAKQSATILNAARETVALATGCDAGDVFFLPSQCAPSLLLSAASLSESRPPSVAVSRIERQRVWQACSAVGSAIHPIEVDHHGHVELDSLTSLSDSSPSTVVIQAANLEIGTCQRLAAVAACVRPDASWLCDATGLLGYLPPPGDPTIVFADAHSFGGPSDVTVAIVREGRRSELAGAEVSASTAAMAASALHAVASDQPALRNGLADLTASIRDYVVREIPDAQVLGDPANQLAQIVAFSFLYVNSEQLGSDLDRAGFGIGSGSACAQRFGMPSHVLTAIGALTHGNVRLGLPITATEDDVRRFLPALVAAVAQNRADR